MTLLKNRQLLALLVGSIVLGALMMIHATSARGALIDDQAAIVNTYRSNEFFQSSTTANVLNSVVATGTVGTAFSTGFTAFSDPQGRIYDGTLDIRGAKKVTVYFTRGGAFGANSVGTTTFSVEVTPDFTTSGATWYTYSKLVQSTSTTQTNAATQSSAIIGDTTGVGADATTTQRFSMDLSTEGFSKLRCKVITTVDGSASCMAAATY